MCCPRNGKQVPRDLIVDATTVFSYHCAQAWEGQTATLASPDTGQKVEAAGLPALLFNLAYGDVGRLSTKENMVMRFPVPRHAAAPADDAANASRLGSYGLPNLYTTWRFRPDWSLLLRYGIR